MSKIYTWSEGTTDVIWQHDLFETEEECIKDAKENYCKRTGEEIAVGTAVPYEVSADVDCMLERLEEDAYDECGEAADDWNISTRKGREKEFDELQEKVTELVNEYLEKIGEKPDFYKIDDIYTALIE